MDSVNPNNCPSFEIICGKKQGTGFLIDPTTILTVKHVVEEQINDEAVEITVYERRNKNSQGFRFKVKDSSSNTLAWLEYVGDGPFPFQPFQLYRKPENRTSAKGICAYGFMGGTESGAPYPYNLKDSGETPNPSTKEYYNVHFSTPSDISYVGLSGSPIFWDDRLYGILGFEKLLDNTRVFGFCAEEFFNDLNSHGYDVPIHPSDRTKILPDSLQVESPAKHKRQLENVLKQAEPGPIFIYAPDGVGKCWLVSNFGRAYQDGDVYWIAFDHDFEKTIEKMDFSIISDDARGHMDKTIACLKKCKHNDILLITGANFEKGYTTELLDQSKGYQGLCSLDMRVIITTRQPIPCVPQNKICLESWPKEDLLRIVGTKWNLGSENQQKMSVLAEQYFNEVEGNPLMVYFASQILSDFSDLEHFTEYIHSLDGTDTLVSAWLAQEIKRENKKFTAKTFWEHVHDICNPDSLTEEEKGVFELARWHHAQSKDLIPKDVFSNCLEILGKEHSGTFYNHCSAFQTLLQKGILAIDADNAVIVPAISRLSFQKQGIAQDKLKNDIFQQKVAELIEKVKSKPDLPTQLAMACDDSYDIGYRKFFKAHTPEDPPCDLCKFDAMMDRIWENTKKNPEKAADELGDAYAFLQTVYPGNDTAALGVFSGKYYSLFAFHRGEPEALENFLKIEPRNIPDFFQRYNLLSIFYGLQSNYVGVKNAAEKAQKKAKHVRPKNTNRYSDIYFQLGLYWGTSASEKEAEEEIVSLQKALSNYGSAITGRKIDNCDDAFAVAEIYRNIAYCHYKCKEYAQAELAAQTALELDLKWLEDHSANCIKCVEDDYGLLGSIYLWEAVDAVCEQNMHEAPEYIKTAEENIKVASGVLMKAAFTDHIKILQVLKYLANQDILENDIPGS